MADRSDPKGFEVLGLGGVALVGVEFGPDPVAIGHSVDVVAMDRIIIELAVVLDVGQEFVAVALHGQEHRDEAEYVLALSQEVARAVGVGMAAVEVASDS